MRTKHHYEEAIAVAASGTENSQWIDISAYSHVLLFAKWTGSGTGTLELQYSPDQVEVVDVASSSQNVASAGNFYWDIVTGANFVRVQVVETGATNGASVELWAYAKG